VGSDRACGRSIRAWNASRRFLRRESGSARRAMPSWKMLSASLKLRAGSD
jgi:hypothetical protein